MASGFRLRSGSDAMTDATALRAEFKEAANRFRHLATEMRSWEENIREHRKIAGNPYYYGGNTEHTNESIVQFTGYASQEKGYELVTEVRAALKEVNRLRVQFA